MKDTSPIADEAAPNERLYDYLDDFVSAYIDDVLIFSSGSLQDHRDKVGKVLQRLMDAGLQLDINKSEFEVKAVKYLGFIIEAECGIRVDPEKGVYARLLGDSGALTRLTKKDVPFRWDGLCEEAFEKLKDLLITAPILAHFHPERETIVEAGWFSISKYGNTLSMNGME
ncbi:reverse transcriptase (RNA-dependent DNA polymerase) [Hirsutella rhossiliensis]